MIFQWSKGIMSRPIKYGGKLFMADGGQIVVGKFMGDCSTWRINDHGKGRGVSQMHFPVI